jgi:hypothetical protein
MKRWVWILSVLAAAAGVVADNTSRGQVPPTKPPADVGPGAGGATLRLPGLESSPMPNANPGADKPPLPDSLKGLWNPSAGSYPAIKPGGTKIALPPSNRVDINKDIEITDKAGNWMIFAMAYTGPKAPEMARTFVAAMRGHYKWNAYVYNYGAKEKQAEFERVEKIRREQMDALEKAGLKADVPIRVPTIRIDEQTGVLVGGYKTRDDAINALKVLRKLDPKGLIDNQVDLDTKYVIELDGPARREARYVNPFLKAFPARNPAVADEQHGLNAEEDMKYLRKINEGESFSLLQCKKPFTLAIKQFNVQFKTTDDAKEAKRLLEKFNKGFFVKGVEWQDRTYHLAHSWAEEFRKGGLSEMYVLHCKYCSYLTVGGYDSPEDPRLLAMQNYLETRFKMDAYRPLELLPRPMPMPVPGVAALKSQNGGLRQP